MTLWLAIVAVGLTLRPTLTSVSPLLPQIREATGMTYPVAALLTSLPVLAMGAGAFAASGLTRRFGERRGVLLGLAALALACGLRFVADDTATMIGTALASGVGIAIIQALLPGVVKANFSAARMTSMMGLYSAALMGGGGLGAAVSPWVAARTDDWRAGLGVWLAVVGAAALAWWRAPLSPLSPLRSLSPMAAPPRAPTPSTAEDLRAACRDASERTEGGAPSMLALLRKHRAWTLAVYFGLINCTYTTMVAWLPPFYQQRGMSATHSGALLAWLTACQVVAALLLPWLARRSVDRRRWLALALAATLAGVVGLVVAPQAAAWWWIGGIGFGLGGTFSLGLVLALDHHAQPRHAAALAAFMQGVGFCIAAVAPFAAGAARAATGSFLPAWIGLIVLNVALLVLTWRFDPAGYASALGLSRDTRGARPRRA
ncbi:MFS transporter [Pandoraea nosoerga]|uniref:MFS transporter n=1 Tax=Pandoraea nosoerga TaxID=2508296 RepID=A0A5E4SYT7_9BURK|nr:MFS transporter [Pandoraea nosoerga]MBN4665713.1 MFS transporter [Pandoraea nosoerga]MBN4675588.1 MFS transporter [Pandoraea nosoerga]MBN4681028.1 MFS transporter [Pandoraea nosoerga]MBN4744752.1 MFS transporter [Pandoraea nosoerga]VVD80755.1 MFS transporter [Pandoraea nosoerga]